jgi:hypothetical protein
MKKLIIPGAAFLLVSALAKGQAPQGLDSIIVEKYYISDVADKAVDATGGVLPVNSTTYRIYVDMKPGYKFEAAYGVDVQPVNVRNPGDHQLRIATTTAFFNNEDRGSTTPNFSKTNAAHNTNMIDSWVTVGGACTGEFGVLKTEDNGVSNAVNTDGVLQNNDPRAGIPLTTQDGFLTGAPESVTMVGITTDVLAFDAVVNGGTNGPVFSTYNGSWASLNGSTGPDADNRVLIAQVTTDGVFSFRLNVQLGTPGGGTESWVADSAMSNEGTHPTLTYMDSLHTTSVAPVKGAAGASFSVYPNPANDALTISIGKGNHSADNSYVIYGVDGKAVASKKLGPVSDNYTERVDVSGLAPGLYFVELTLDGAKSTRKITKN